MSFRRFAQNIYITFSKQTKNDVGDLHNVKENDTIKVRIQALVHVVYENIPPSYSIAWRIYLIEIQMQLKLLSKK